jgi:hypothetical protein
MPGMNTEDRKRIADEFRNCVTKTISRIEAADTYRPFHTALLSDEALFWSRFERSFSTSFGQRVIEEISKIVALSGGASDASRQKETDVRIDAAKDNAITEHVALLRSGTRMNWNDSLNSIIATPSMGLNASVRVISDLWWIKSGVNHYMSIKTVKPNIDQTAIAKSDLLRLKVNDPDCEVFFGLYYNPYGEDKSSYAHNPPMGVFDFHNDPVVLIGQDYWGALGGLGTYDTVLGIAREVGADTRALVQSLWQQQ